jgi:integrase
MGLDIKPGPGGIWRIAGTVAGQRIRRSAKTRDQGIARQLAHALEARAWARHIHGDAAVVTFEEAALAYMKDGGERRFLAPLIRHFKGRLAGSIRPAELREAARALYPRAAGATLNRQALAPARAVINFAHGQGWCPPIRVKQFRAAKPERQAVGAAWLAAFRAAARAARLPYLAALARFLFENGARVGEACGVRPSDCDPRARRIWLRATKNGEDYTVTISAGLAAELMALKPRRARVFGYRSRNSVYGVWERTCARAGIARVPPHQAGRHSFATALDAAGWTASQIAAAGRWKSVRLVAETYVHPGDAAGRAAELVGEKLARAEAGDVASLGQKRANRN